LEEMLSTPRSHDAKNQFSPWIPSCKSTKGAKSEVLSVTTVRPSAAAIAAICPSAKGVERLRRDQKNLQVDGATFLLASKSVQVFSLERGWAILVSKSLIGTVESHRFLGNCPLQKQTRCARKVGLVTRLIPIT